MGEKALTHAACGSAMLFSTARFSRPASWMFHVPRTVNVSHGAGADAREIVRTFAWSIRSPIHLMTGTANPLPKAL